MAGPEKIQHSGRAHAKLGASAAARWIACPPSVQHSSPETENRTSAAAEEGTAAHELSELLLAYRLGDLSATALDRELNAFEETNPYYSTAMREYVQGYVDYVMEQVDAMRAEHPDSLALIEQRLDFSHIAPGGFGTGDVVLVAPGTVRVIDLKYGRGIRVDGENNPQLRLYALGALAQYDMLYEIEEVTTTIVQPRLGNITGETLPAEELLEWAYGIVKPAALKAEAGAGEYTPGDHCTFCPIAATCRARAEQGLELAEEEFFGEDPATLSAEEVAEVLQRGPALEKWLKQLSAYALERATTGRDKYPGFKVVEGRSNRRITQPDELQKRLRNRKFKVSDIMKPQELRPLGELEKLVGKKKFEAVAEGLVEKPPGKPALVEETDSRPEWNPAAADFEEELLS